MASTGLSWPRWPLNTLASASRSSCAVRFNTVEIAFDTDANRKVTLPLYLYPDCVKDYPLQVKQGGSWRDLLEVQGNYVRKRVHTFPEVQSSGLRLRVNTTNGAPSARLYEVRVYQEA